MADLLKKPETETISVFFNNDHAMLSNARAMKMLLEGSCALFPGKTFESF
jgi:hypothetical protein